MLDRLARQLRFARHIPPRQMVHRMLLSVRRTIETTLPPDLDGLAKGVTLRTSPLPQPVFKPRSSGVGRVADGWHFQFLGKGLVLPVDQLWLKPAETGVDQLWQMNLHYMEYLESLDVADSLELMRSWVAQNPPFTRSGWRASWNSYAVSIRIVIWLQQLSAHPALVQPDIVKSVAEQTGFLARHLERDIGGNHLIKNIKALIWASACFSGKTADDWRQTGLGLLHAELDRQILTDGFHYEKSPSYHAQVFADLLEIRYALAEIEEDCRFLEPILDTMAAAIAGMTHPDGGPVLFNDAGLTMAYAPQDCLRGYQAVCAKSVPSLKRAHFGDAGYTAHRGDDFALFIDMGRIGPDDLPAHAHADIGTFELSVGGHRFVVDQGVFEYVDGPRRQQARDSVSHNVLTIDGESQAELFGAFRCGKRPMVTVERYDMRDGGFTLCGSHDGFAPYHVSRSFDVDGNRIVICDTIAGAGYGAASAGLLLHPDCRVTIADGCATVSRAGWCIRISTTAHVAVEPAVYWPDMGIEQQTSRLRLTLPPDSRECKTDIAIMQI